MDKRIERERDRETFAGYVQSTAFSVSLSRNMVLYLDDAVRTRDTEGRRISKSVLALHMGIYHSLERRGLVAWHRDSEGRANGMYVTEAGYAMHELLRIAGLVEKRDQKTEAA